MNSESVTAEQIVRVLIAWMLSEGIAPTRTRIVKFLYLSDLQYARYHGGQTLTGWRWYLDSFGPFAAEALSTLDRGVAEGWLGATEIDAQRGSVPAAAFVAERRKVAIIYTLANAPLVAAEEDALPLGFGKVRHWIRLYGSDTNALLRFVYGNTEPMENAQVGGKLDFGRAQPIVVAKPIDSRPFTKSEKKSLGDILGRMREKYVTARTKNDALHLGPLDSVYFKELPPEDDDPIEGDTILVFPEKE